MANMSAMSTGDRRFLKRAILPALVLATAGMLVAATSAFGQAAVEQYIPDVSPAGHHNNGSGGGSGGGSGTATISPSTGSGSSAASGKSSGNGGSGSGSGSDSANAKKAAAAGVAGLALSNGGGGGSSGGGNAPGTDFPLTTFIFIVAAIFLAGLIVYMLLRRRRPRSASL